MKNNFKYFYILFFLVLVVLACTKLFESKNYLTIENHKQKVVSNVRLEYSNGDSINIGKLDPASEFKIKLSQSVNENSINLVYTDENNIVKNVLVVPYFVLAENLNYNYKIE
ncbi:MAG: hypothetical protein IPJ53_13355 [Saprospiraceae bacterium]|nr:hypothetical protein [Candidatus Vicinibacter affinis]